MDKASEVMKIVEWYLKGQGACFTLIPQHYNLTLFISS